MSGNNVLDQSTDTEVLLRNLPMANGNIAPSAYALPPASLTFRDLSFKLPDTKRWPCISKSKTVGRTILQPCNGHFDPGELVALMGPSGSGKTTLLDMLAMKKTAPYEGEVSVNGRPRDKRLFRRIAAYVGQEDIMPPHWKVREAISFNAKLKYTPVRTHRNVDAWVDVLLDSFGLGAVQDSLIGGIDVRGISGGQRRRVSLARGVAAHASLLFCDEPTSGLSATDAELCIRALRVISKRLCVTTVVVIHQPRTEVAELFDRLVLLTSFPGRMVYFGGMDKAQAYWANLGHPVPANVNPTDWFMDTATPGTRQDISEFLVKAFTQNEYPTLIDQVERQMLCKGLTMQDMLGSRSGSRPSSYGEGDGKSRKHSTGFCTQIGVLLGRKVRLTVRNPLALGLPLLVPVVQGIIVGYMFEGTGHKRLDRQVMFSFCLLTMLCLAGTMGLVVLINDRILMKYEASEQLYSEFAWAFSTQVVDVPIALVGALLNVAVMLFFAEMQAEIYRTIVLWALLLFFVYDSLFSFIAAVAADTRQAQVLASPCVSIFMLFNGFVVTKADAPSLFRWIFYISPNAYAMEAIAQKLAEADDSLAGQMLLTSFGIDATGDSKGIQVMLGMIVCLRFGQLIALKKLNHIQR